MVGGSYQIVPEPMVGGSSNLLLNHNQISEHLIYLQFPTNYKPNCGDITVSFIFPHLQELLGTYHSSKCCMDLSCQRGFQFISLLVVGWVEVRLLCFTLSAFIRLRFCAPGQRISQTISQINNFEFYFLPPTKPFRAP